MTDVARSTNVLGLYPGSLYNVTIVAESKSGKGPGSSGLFWTEVGGKYLVNHKNGDLINGIVDKKLK